MEFLPFPKIARLNRQCTITEKIDGTNAQVHVDEDGVVTAGSRTRWITPKEDNFGFAAWVHKNEDDLRKLGPGSHFGEWWGSGIQRGYGLQKGEKRFSLFNAARWSDPAERPACCGVVPVLHQGTFATLEIENCLAFLRSDGSVAAPGFMKPEGIIIWHDAARQMFKVTLEKDEEPKSISAAA
jgi:hypothetical protein